MLIVDVVKNILLGLFSHLADLSTYHSNNNKISVHTTPTQQWYSSTTQNNYARRNQPHKASNDRTVYFQELRAGRHHYLKRGLELKSFEIGGYFEGLSGHDIIKWRES